MKIVKNKLELFEFEKFSGIPTIQHFVSTRKGGVSGNGFASLNLGNYSHDNEFDINKNRQILANEFNLKITQLIFPKQTHTSNIQIVSKENYLTGFTETDALVTNEPSLLLCVQVADCVPILLYDTKKHVVAAIHAGWRGTVAQIAAKTVQMMSREYSSNPEDILAGIGTSICPNCYEVGIDVVNSVLTNFYSTEKLIHKKNGKTYFNLWEANKVQLLEAGLSEYNIEIANLCTIENPDLFYSYRRDGEKTGRFAAGILLKQK